MRSKWLSLVLAAACCISAVSGAAVSGRTTVPLSAAAVSAGTDPAEMPADYQTAAEWILNNRILAEGSVKDWATIYDQIVAGNGTLNYVVKWQTKQTITLEQRQKLQTVLETAVNDWTDWLVGYDNWPFQHVNVNIVGWAVLDKDSLLDLQPDETVFTETVPADTSYITGGMAVGELPTLEPIGDETRYRYIHWADTSYQYPGGYENRYDMYLQATQGMIDMGGFGYHWGQQLSDNAVLGLIDGTSSIHILEHEMGHGFGLTDFYGGEGESDGFPPGGFPGGGTSIMMAGSSQTITDFDGWFFRYLWSYLADEAGRFDLSQTPVTTTTTTETTVTTTTTVTTETTTVSSAAATSESTAATTEPERYPVSFTDTIAEIQDGQVTFREHGTYYFSGTAYYGDDASKNLMHYEAGDQVRIEFVHDAAQNILEITLLELIENSHKVPGDVNADGVCTVADTVMLQKWLLGQGSVTDWEAGDLNSDARLDGFDLCLLRGMLL